MKKLLALVVLATIAGLAYAQASVSNLPIQLIASGAYTQASVVSTDRSNPSWRGVQVTINISAYTSGTYTPHIEGKDPVSGAYYDILVGSALNGTGTTLLSVYPGITATGNVSASNVLPATWRVEMVGASTPSATFSVGGFLQQ